jgi:hypothetical protein
MPEKLLGVLLAAFLLLNFSGARGQDYAESALLFSRNKPAGSARILGIGGAQTALGGDFSSSQSNPAGVGMFNRSEFTFSLGYTNNNTASTHNGVTTDGTRGILNVPGLSYTHHLPAERGAFLGGALSFSLTRTNDFNRAVKYAAPNGDNSIIDYFIDNAFGQTTAQFDEDGSQYNSTTGLAYFNYLIGPWSSIDSSLPDDEYFTDANFPDLQQEEIVTKGASNQWNASYGANFDDKYFVGGGLGISSLRYKSQKTFTESFSNPDTIHNMILNEFLDLSGTGINLTFGLIARPVDFLQIGLSYKTPTLIGITETYYATMSTRWDNFDYYDDGSEILGDNTNDPVGTDEIISEYDLVIPSKLSTGIAFLSRFGFLSADIDFTNPSKSKYKSNIAGVSFDNDNKAIKAVYQRTVNYRVGAEYRAGIFRIRAGYGLMANTFRKNIMLIDDEFNTSTNQFETVDLDDKIQTISAGLGIRKKSFYVDVAVMRSTSKSYYQPYTYYDYFQEDYLGPVVRQKNTVVNGVVTLGFTF